MFQLEESSDLGYFLERDIFDTAFIPKHHLHRLEVVLSIPKIEEAGGYIPFPEQDLTKTQCLEIVKPLSTLLMVKHQREFDLRIFIKCYEDTSVGKFQEAMVPIVRRLKAAGFQVKAEHLSPYEGLRPSLF